MSLAFLVAEPPVQEPVWPMASGSHEVLQSFQNPFAVTLSGHSVYDFHTGVDLRGSLEEVVAMRGGTVRVVWDNANNAGLVVEVQTPHGVEEDAYAHLLIDPWQVGDSIQAGDVIGVVSDRAFPGSFVDHVHINRFEGGHLVSPLAIFSDPADRDPHLHAAAPQDANEDGVVFHVAPDGQPTLQLPYAFAAVELVLEATDRQSSTVYWHQAVVGVGYWVESRAGGDDVASAAEPYRLMRFDDAWTSSGVNCDSKLPLMMVTAPEHFVSTGPTNIEWDTLATYRLTRAAGFLGRCADVSAGQAWHTDALAGFGAPNGTGAAPAREIHEARFPDGRYRVHALTEDTLGELDTVYGVVVDNFRPYVESLRVLHARSGALLYRARWSFDAATGLLTFERFVSALAPQLVRPGHELRIEVEFSEPMASAEIVAIEPALGPQPALVSSQDPERRTLWTAKLEVVRIPLQVPRLQIAGTDLAGTTLFPFHTSDAHSAPFNKRESAAPLDDPTRDTLHFIPLDGGRRPEPPGARR